jgi:Cyclic nucleotide-binding domain/Tetratricopeptide repeat
MAGRDVEIQELIARKNYAKAVGLLKSELAKRPRDPRLRLQYADTLILAGRNREAVAAFMELADEHARDGFAAKAIAVLKRIEKIEPGRRDVEERLANLIQEKVRAAPTPAAPARSAAPEFGLEEFDPSADPLAAEPVAAEPELVVVTPEPEPADEAPTLEIEELEYLSAEEAEAAPAAESKPALSTPLFEGLSADELMAVMRGLNLLTFEAGDILVAEGAPGDSMFILTDGIVKAFVRNPKGHYMKVKDLMEGDFFGEISVLTGKPRTATITAATHVEVLELGKATLDSITKQYPRVREVLKKFQEQRAQETVQAIIRSRD